MSSLYLSFAIAALCFAFGGFGLFLSAKLPAAHTSDRSRDIIGGVVGLVTLLLALVLGLLIWTAFGVTNSQKNELQLLSARALECDLELKQYGPEANLGRELLRTEMVWAHKQFWGDGDSKSAYAASYSNMASMSDFLTGLHPTTEKQRQLLAGAGSHYGAIGETRLLMSLQLVDAISWPLIITVVSWSCLLFTGFGLLSRANATTLAMLAVGASAVASALFLILDLSQPYSGLLRISPAGLEQVIVDLNN